MTHIFHYNAETKTFDDQGNLTKVSEADLKLIAHGTFVFTPHYTIKTSQKNVREKIAAFIVGTTDVGLIERLRTEEKVRHTEASLQAQRDLLAKLEQKGRDSDLKGRSS